MAISQRRLALEEFLRLPEEKPALELVAGRVTQKVSPRGPHGRLQFFLGHLIANFGESTRVAAVFTETRVSIAGDSVVPDLIVYRWERVPRDERGDVALDFMTPPDIAVEIISPGQTLRNLEDRCRWYVANGVPVSLLIHPRRRTVTCFRPAVEPETLSDNDRIALDEVLLGFELTVAQLFGALSFR
jgi:Uma2 family endonuclease